MILRATSSRFLPPNTVTLLETNPKFVESFLVGLNAEMSREILWRNYPTDQRDIGMIHTWGDRQLGQNASTGEQLVLLLRGELLQRYPNAVIYAVKAGREAHGPLYLSPKSEDERHPLFRGTLKPDVTFLGVNLTRDKALADPGWFFVI